MLPSFNGWYSVDCGQPFRLLSRRFGPRVRSEGSDFRAIKFHAESGCSGAEDAENSPKESTWPFFSPNFAYCQLPIAY